MIDGGTVADLVGPTQEVLVFVDREELAGALHDSLGDAAVPGPHGHIGDGIVVAS